MYDGEIVFIVNCVNDDGNSRVSSCHVALNDRQNIELSSNCHI